MTVIEAMRITKSKQTTAAASTTLSHSLLHIVPHHGPPADARHRSETGPTLWAGPALAGSGPAW